MGKFIKFLLFPAIFFGLSTPLFFHLGEFLDISEKPENSDLIVSMGGDRDYDHLKKAIQLYKAGYSKSAYIMINSYDYRKKQKHINLYDLPHSHYLVDNGISKKKILFMHNASNTMEELRFIKKFLLSHNMKSVIIVSSPPHLRRIRFLAQLNNYKNNHIHITLIGSNPLWWNRKQWYNNPISRTFVISELIKFPINYLKYALLEPLGLLGPCREICHPLLIKLNKIFRQFLFYIRTF